MSYDSRPDTHTETDRPTCADCGALLEWDADDSDGREPLCDACFRGGIELIPNALTTDDGDVAAEEVAAESAPAEPPIPGQ